MKFLTCIDGITSKPLEKAILTTYFSELPNPFLLKRFACGGAQRADPFINIGPLNGEAPEIETLYNLYQFLLREQSFDYLIRLKAHTYVRTPLLKLLLKRFCHERPSLMHYMGVRLRNIKPRDRSSNVSPDLQPVHNAAYCDPEYGYILSRRAMEIVLQDLSPPIKTGFFHEGSIHAASLAKRKLFATLIPPEPFRSCLSSTQIITMHREDCSKTLREADLGVETKWRPQKSLKSILLPRASEIQPCGDNRTPSCPWPEGSEEAKHFNKVQEVVHTDHPYPKGRFRNRGIVICGGGADYFPSAWVCIKMLRQVGCELPIELWHLGPEEMSPRMRSLVNPLGVTTIDAHSFTNKFPVRKLAGWELKCYSMIHSRFRQILLLDADNVPVRDPSFLFDTSAFRETGALFWPDRGRLSRDHSMWRLTGVPYRDEPEFESGQIVINKSRCWKALQIAMHFNEYSDFYYKRLHGDKDTFRFAFHLANKTFVMVFPRPFDVGTGFYQLDFDGKRLFQHRCLDKWTLDGAKLRLPGFRMEAKCLEFLRRLKRLWDPSELSKQPPRNCSSKRSTSTQHDSTVERKSDNVCIVQTGRYGDILNILPLAEKLWNMGHNPAVTVGAEFADILNGVSYARPLVVPAPYNDYSQVWRLAHEQQYETIIDAAVDGHGLSYNRMTATYNEEAYLRAGFHEMFSSGAADNIILDRRDKASETQLLQQYEIDEQTILISGSSFSSPFPPPLLDELKSALDSHRVLDISNIRAKHLTDLLAFYDRAGLLITCDTATLHLAGASNIPYIALLSDAEQWKASYTRGNCLARIPYSAVLSWLPFLKAIARATLSQQKRSHCKFLDLCYVPPFTNTAARRREHLSRVTRRGTYALGSWTRQEVTDSMLPSTFHDTGKRRLPYIKDILDFGSKAAQQIEAVIVFSNADTCYSPQLTKLVSKIFSRRGTAAAWGARRDFKELHHSLLPEEISEGHLYAGTDIFLFRPDWWFAHREQFPAEMLHGTEAWDCILRELMRANGGVEIDDLVYHQRHDSTWEHHVNRYRLASQRVCLPVAYRWLQKRGLDPEAFGVRLP